MYAIYDPPAPAALARHSNGGHAGTVTIAGVDDPEAPTEIVIAETSGRTEGRTRPAALRPHPGGRRSIPAAWAGQSTPSPPGDRGRAAESARHPGYIGIWHAPPTPHGSAGPLPRSGDDVADIAAALRDLDHSYVAVHGPPGPGKTYTAATVIAELVNDTTGGSASSPSPTRWWRTCSDGCDRGRCPPAG